MKNTIKTAVFPVAGIGSRFLPVTKAAPKEMLPIIDRPVIQYAVDEAIKAGITQLIFVTSDTKRSIEDYFDSHFELEYRLAEKKNFAALGIIKSVIPPNVNCVYIRQPYPLGLGDAVLRAKNIIGDCAFAVILADDVIYGSENCLEAMLKKFYAYQSSVLAVEMVAAEDVSKYGIVATNQEGKVIQIIEKPSIHEAPSNIAVIGRYILTPRIFELLESIKPGAAGEIQLTDAIARLTQIEKVYTHVSQGHRYDCGSPLGLIKATIDFSLQNSALRDDVKKHIEQALNNN